MMTLIHGSKPMEPPLPRIINDNPAPVIPPTKQLDWLDGKLKNVQTRLTTTIANNPHATAHKI